MVAGGQSFSNNVQVHASAFIGGGGDVSGLKQSESGCYITTKEGTGVLDFVALEKAAVKLNHEYFEHPPTLQLQADASFKRLGTTDHGIEYITLNSCSNQAACANMWKDAMSVADNFLFGKGTWNGIQGSIQPDPSITYVFNVSMNRVSFITLYIYAHI